MVRIVGQLCHCLVLKREGNVAVHEPFLREWRVEKFEIYGNKVKRKCERRELCGQQMAKTNIELVRK